MNAPMIVEIRVAIPKIPISSNPLFNLRNILLELLMIIYVNEVAKMDKPSLSNLPIRLLLNWKEKNLCDNPYAIIKEIKLLMRLAKRNEK